jgi:hypothetical protein
MNEEHTNTIGFADAHRGWAVGEKGRFADYSDKCLRTRPKTAKERRTLTLKRISHHLRMLDSSHLLVG